MSRCVTLLGTVSIQDYLFRSNRLKENLGASWIVFNALEEWSEQWRQTPGCESLLFVGGGKAALEFNDIQQARRAVENWSFRLLKEYPGLQVRAWHKEINLSKSLSTTFQCAQKGLAQHENEPALGSELGSLPVFRECSSTGLAASGIEGDEWLSAESLAKTKAAAEATERLKQEYGSVLRVADKSCMFPDDLENLGQREGASHIAIVHADGNGIGKIFQAICEQPGTDDEFRRRISALSHAINRIATNAFRRTLEDLSRVLPELDEHGIHLTPIKSDTSGTQFWYPVRPIVDGGDDLTFVCQGRLGLALATRYLSNFSEESKLHSEALNGQSLTACAGVLIMPQKFPFARGYRLSERLTDSAKQQRQSEKSSASWIDFHVLIEGSAGSLSAIRSSYSKPFGELLLRPYVLEQNHLRAWQSFEERVQRFQDRQQWPRSRSKLLLQALVRGQDETAQLLKQFATRGISLPAPAWEYDNGGKPRSPYFDPIELLDFHTIVRWPESQENSRAIAH